MFDASRLFKEGKYDMSASQLKFHTNINRIKSLDSSDSTAECGGMNLKSSVPLGHGLGGNRHLF